MAYEILFAPEAREDLRDLTARERSSVVGRIGRHLLHEPTKTSRSRIKRRRGLSKPQYRLRVDDIRVFYDVGQRTVEVLAVVRKRTANEWLNKYGEQ